MKKIKGPQWHTKKIRVELELTALNQFEPGKCVDCPFRDYSIDEFELFLYSPSTICEKSICQFGCTRRTCPITKCDELNEIPIYNEIVEASTQKS